jgi:hypothetical protein
MKIYTPFHLISEESRQEVQDFNEQAAQMDVSDENLKDYVVAFHRVYRSTLEQFFQPLTPFIPFYTSYPFETLVLRIGNNGMIIGHSPSADASVRIMRPADLDSPLEEFNIFNVIERWQVPFANFDFRIREYSEEEAELEAWGRALSDALDYLWRSITPEAFSQLCVELLKAEGIMLETEVEGEGRTRFDAKGQVTLLESAGFTRIEQWAFEFKPYQAGRVSAQYLRQLEEYFEASESQIDTLCLITSGDLTSVGNHVAVENPRIRVWDRSILQYLVNQHLETLEPYFVEYKVAVDAMSQQAEGEASVTGKPESWH